VSDPGVQFILFVIGMYLLPSIIAFARRMKNCWSVFFLNLFFGWTVIGWVACLCWSVAGTAELKTAPVPAVSFAPLNVSSVANDVVATAKAKGYQVTQFAPTNITFAKGILTVNCASEGDLLQFKRQLESESRTSA
jgi:hypothetical protein